MKVSVIQKFNNVKKIKMVKYKTFSEDLPSIKPNNKPNKVYKKTKVQKLFAKGLLKFYQHVGGYGQSANIDFEKMFARDDVSLKKMLLYIHSGGLRYRELLHANSLEEIERSERKSLLKKVVRDDIAQLHLNRYIFPEISDIFPVKHYTKNFEAKLMQDFPLLPKNEKEYSVFIEKLVESVGIKMEKLPKEKVDNFNRSLAGLKDELVGLSDDEFAQKNISEYKNLKEILDCIPELESTIGRVQHGAHYFDVFKHSLKVLKKIGEDDGFKNLNQSDQKVMMLGALMHDITKKAGVVDHEHPLDGSFDTYFITKRFNLSSVEENKLYKLIKNHEWLKYVNIKSKERREYRMKNVAWELMQDNLFDMSLIFTHADLKAVKKDDFFHDTIKGSKNLKLDGKIRSFGESADIYGKEIKKKILELQYTQPLMPVTKIPKASQIKKFITDIKPDGSTDIKGVYVDKNGLVVLKFNEIEDWEKIGFPKGSTSTGINVTEDKTGKSFNTGNIKFFAHGLDFENQLARFNAFTLPDSTALLSVSYAERPESKYRFFRPQGLIGNSNTFNIVGGGISDAGSGFKKNIKQFRYLIEYTSRKQWRPFISNLIKKVTGMEDDAYRDFVLKNQNKAFSEIYPEDFRNKIIQSIGAVKSHVRGFGREYSEYYVSEFEPMAPYAYNVEDSPVGNPIEFLNRTLKSKDDVKYGKTVAERTEFLKEYAIKKDFPFVVFGE